MKKQIRPVEVYLKEKIKSKKMDINYNRGKEYGIDTTTFNFISEPVKEPYGDVAFITGYDNDPDYTSTFLMSAQEAMKLGKMLIDTAYEAMDAKRIIMEAESYDARLSFLVLKGLIDSIRIIRSIEKLENYKPPYYKYTIAAYKGDEKLLNYSTVYNLSYFTSEAQIKYWIDKLTDKERVKIYFDNWNPYMELEQRRSEAQNNVMESLKKLNLKPSPIKKEENINNNLKIVK